MKVRYIGSACVSISTPDTTVLTDPWFTQGAFDGSWYQYPGFERDPVDVAGFANIIYISHIHPDHYDPRFLARYLGCYPAVRLLIGETSPPFLLKKMQADGFSPEVVTDLDVGRTRLSIIANHAYEFMAIDTCLVARYGELSIANMNDNHLDEAQVEAVRGRCPGGHPTLALLPYNAAGPYPQTYWFDSEEELARARESVEKLWQDRYGAYVDALRPERAVPFAGLYWLGGPLSALNGNRAFNDAVTLKSLYPDVTIVPADGGEAIVDLSSLNVTHERDRPYDNRAVQEFLNRTGFPGYDYEREILPLEYHRFQIQPLLSVAFREASRRAKLSEPCWFCVRPSDSEKAFAFEPFTGVEPSATSDISSLEPRMEVIVDPRYLYGLITRFYHWNNAEIGSHLRMRRTPNVFRRDVHNFLTFLHV